MTKGDAQHVRKEKGWDADNKYCRHRRANGEAPRSYGAVFLFGMLPVAFDIPQVVYQIDRAGEDAKEDESGKGARQKRDIFQVARENHARKKQEVFCPLFWAQGFYQGGKQINPRKNYSNYTRKFFNTKTIHLYVKLLANAVKSFIMGERPCFSLDCGLIKPQIIKP